MKQKISFQRIVSLLLILCLLCTSCGDSNKASSMQLTKTEGTVRLLDEEGKSISTAENLRLYSGYDLTTAYRSYAWINLDSVKLTKLDSSSEIEIRKNGNDLEIIVTAGKLYFNITEPLSDEETLNIRTSTMAVGIRGTCGWVEASDERHMKVYILEGTVECSVTDPESGQSETGSVSGGESAEIYLEDSGETGITVEPFSEEDVVPFVLEELKQDEELRNKIQEDSGLDLSKVSAGAGPGNPVDQAAKELARLLGNAVNEEGSLRKRMEDAMDRTTDAQLSAEGDFSGLLLSLQDSLIDDMLNGTMDGSEAWWAQEFASVIASNDTGDSDLDSVDYMQIRMGRDINCYKPNIYVYGEPGTEFKFSFVEPVLLTKTLPEYVDCWEVEIAEDRTLTVDGQAGYPFLFYESRTIPGIFQTEEGFLVKTEDRAAQFAEILEAYGLNEQEIRDFVEFWDEMLDADADYLMYPQTTELVDNAMPIEISGAKVDHYFRLWFCFREADEEWNENLTQPKPVPASHDGTAIVEWGGMILP